MNIKAFWEKLSFRRGGSQEVASLEERMCCGFWRDAMKRHPHIDQLMTHIPNGGKRNKITGALLKAMGTVAGQPDYFLAKPHGPYHGLYIEVKTPVAPSPPESQRMIIDQRRKDGYAVAVCYSRTEMDAALELYLDPANVNHLDGVKTFVTTMKGERREWEKAQVPNWEVKREG